MSVRGIGDGFAVQRLVWLLIGTIIVPTLLLTLFGISAIRNERAASTQRERLLRESHVQQRAADLITKISEVDRHVRSYAATCDLPCPRPPGVAALWIWTDTPPSELSTYATPHDGPTQWSSPADGAAPIGLFSVNGRSVAMQLNLGALDTFLLSREPNGANGGYTRLEAIRSGPIPTVEMTFNNWADAPTRLPLASPFANWSLVLEFPEGVKRQSRSIATFYISGLVALVSLVLLGTALTLRSTAREIRLSRLQTDFVSHLSHELRTPMTSIQIFIETLQSGRIQDPDRVRECLDLLAQESARLSRHIERVLEWGRMEAGRRVYDFEPVSSKTLIESALHAFRSQTLTDDALIVKTVDAEPCHFLVDSDSIVDALLNLLQNAHKHSAPPQHIQIGTVRSGRETGIFVQDNGPGIPQHERKRIFEKFYQVDALLSRHSEGSGLGLAIVRAVVQSHGGRVSLKSELGEGSRFTLWLPQAQP